MPCVALALIPIALVSMYLNDSAQKDDAGEEFVTQVNISIVENVEQLMTELQPPIISSAVAGLVWIYYLVFLQIFG